MSTKGIIATLLATEMRNALESDGIASSGRYDGATGAWLRGLADTLNEQQTTIRALTAERDQLRATLAESMRQQAEEVNQLRARLAAIDAAPPIPAGMFTADEAEDFYFQGFDACYNADDMGDMGWKAFWSRSKALKLVQERTK